MAGSSPGPRRSYHWSSPQRSDVSDFLYEDRNSKARHELLLEAAKREHERVRAEAEKVYRDHLYKEEQARLEQEKKKEEERIRVEEQIAIDRLRLHELKAKKVDIPPLPEPDSPRTATPRSATTAAAAKSTIKSPVPDGNITKNGVLSKPPSLLNGDGAQSTSAHTPAHPALANPFASSKPLTSAPAPISSPLSSAGQNQTPQQTRITPPPAAEAAKPHPEAVARNPFAPAPANQAVAPTTAKPPPIPTAAPATDRYSAIHGNLKQLRRALNEQVKVNAALKARMGDMRREIRKCVGQLVAGQAAANKPQIQRLISLLKEALENRVQSQLIDPASLTLHGQPNIGPQLPSLFLYLLNIFSKAVINQFINEGGAKPETADPVGVVASTVLAEPDFAWQGKSLIDILLAKYRVSCPVLFGYRGNEKTEAGRKALGWRRDGDGWMAEQQHMDRMTGLGAGYGAIALRNFGKSKKQNPYPPSHYWMAMAAIVNTPAADISNTQCVVLKAMIQHYEQKFLTAYGTAAVAALRLALVEFPARAPQKSAAINSLQVLAQMLKRDTGLSLA